jgi:NADH-quinone oxidoreductase subunit E
VSPTQIEDDVAAIARRWKDKRGSLIMALHALQDRYGYVPRDAALKSPGKHVVSVCMGTACYLKGAPHLLDVASRKLGIAPGQTTPDEEYHLQVVRCVGCCGLAPVVTINEKLLAKVTDEVLDAHLEPGKAQATAATPAQATAATGAQAGGVDGGAA